jgi:Hydrazine synthase alpha subunit middle domain/WD40-like Beta Propeller Repeat
VFVSGNVFNPLPLACFCESVNGSREYVALMMTAVSGQQLAALPDLDYTQVRIHRRRNEDSALSKDDSMNCGVSAMSHEANTEVTRARHLLRRGVPSLLATLIATSLAACSSGSGGTDVTIGSGQTADPVTLDFPVFYVKRPVPDPDDEDVMENDARLPLRFEIGADLFLRDRASPSAPEVNLTAAQTEGLGDIRDVDVSFDGSKVIFSMRAQFIEGADEEDQPKWAIWEYDTTTKVLRRVIASDTTADEGHDIMPQYLPDGRIVFTSTRQRQSRAILLDENKPQFAAQVEAGDEQPAFLLHVMDEDGSNINQITFNQSHDLDPSVLNDGRILYTHWEQALGGSQMDLYAVNPDGSDLQLLYGAHSHATGTEDPLTDEPSIIQFLQPRAMADGRTLALIRPFTGTSEGGDLVLIDTAAYVDNTRGSSPANAGLNGPAQTRALPTDVRTIPGPSPGGRYRSAYPLYDGTNRLLVSWSQCRLIEEGRIVPCTVDRLENTTTPLVEAPPLYGVYVYDVRDGTQKPIVAPEEGFIYTDVVSGSARPLPPVISNNIPNADLLAEGVGILHIRSVYDIDGNEQVPGVAGGIAVVSNPSNPAYANRPARFLRIEKVVSQPDEDTFDVPDSAFGPGGRGFGMRDIIGYAPIEPDGSVMVKVPANVALTISVVDARGRRLPGTIGSLHSNWLQVVPGETMECNGCHNANANPRIAHGRKGLTDSVNTGAASTGAIFPGTNPLLGAVDMGETMAEARGRAMCDGACEASVNLIYPQDYWTAGTPAAGFDACYRAGTATDVVASPTADPVSGVRPTYMCAASDGIRAMAGFEYPTTAACEGTWNSLCRVTINYEKRIHPMWNADRFVDANMDGINDQVGGVDINHKCTTCHAPVDAANAAQVPAGQLDLTDGPSDLDPDHFRSYEELLSGDDAEILNAMGQLEPECIQFDANNACLAFRQVGPSMIALNARGSRFFTRMGQADHRDFMSPAELRLLSEWLDIGAQYYNDPFAAPED